MAGERTLRQIKLRPPRSRSRSRSREGAILVLAAVGLAGLVTPWLADHWFSEVPVAGPDLLAATSVPSPLDTTPVPPVETVTVTRGADVTAAIVPAPVALTPRAPSVEVQASPQPYSTTERTEADDTPLITSSLPDPKSVEGAVARRRGAPSDGESALPRAFRPRPNSEASASSRTQSIPDHEVLRPLLRRQPDAGERVSPPRRTATREPSRGPVRAPTAASRADWNLPNSLLPIR